MVVKADGLAAGKGVFVCANRAEARAAARSILVDNIFGAAGNQIVIEECLVGQEASILAIIDGDTIVPLDSAQDHKRAHDGDRGPNTRRHGSLLPCAGRHAGNHGRNRPQHSRPHRTHHEGRRPPV
ncbi:MAG UNVERIFIED_CONTAM: hypothetical protein LVR18_26035 [Planctomycetaceae bacterium]